MKKFFFQLEVMSRIKELKTNIRYYIYKGIRVLPQYLALYAKVFLVISTVY